MAFCCLISHYKGKSGFNSKTSTCIISQALLPIDVMLLLGSHCAVHPGYFAALSSLCEVMLSVWVKGHKSCALMLHLTPQIETLYCGEAVKTIVAEYSLRETLYSILTAFKSTFFASVFTFCIYFSTSYSLDFSVTCLY